MDKKDEEKVELVKTYIQISEKEPEKGRLVLEYMEERLKPTQDKESSPHDSTHSSYRKMSPPVS